MAEKSTVAVCSLTQSDNEYKHFISVLKEQCGVCVKYVHISSRILENGHDFAQYDGVILIHSVYRGRMSLTDVRDARYDTLLPHLKSLLGSDRVAVIITGVERTTDLEELFKEKQPTVIECSAHVLFCGAGDPMNHDHVANAMKSFVRLLPDRPKVRKGQAKPSKVTTTISDDSTNNETMTIKTKKMKCAGIDVKNGKDKVHVELIICSEWSTRKTLLKTLSEGDLQDEADFLIFKQRAPSKSRLNAPLDDWELLEARSIASFDPSSELIHCAVFIFRNELPPDFKEDHFKVFETIINGRTSPTLVEVRGKADESCLQQLLKVFLECAYNDHIVTVSSGGVQTASSFSGNQTQREREHQYEATLKKEARGRIQILNRTIRTLKQELSCKEDELTTCEENISVKHCEQKKIESDVDAIQKNLGRKKRELQSLNENTEKAQQKLDEIRNGLQTEDNARRAKRELKQIHEKKEQELKDRDSDQRKTANKLHDRERAVREAEYQMTKKKEQQSLESESWENALKEEIEDLNQVQKKKEEVLHNLEGLKSDVKKAATELVDLQNSIKEGNEDLDAIHETKKEVSRTLEDWKNDVRKTSSELSDIKNAIWKAQRELKQIQEKMGQVPEELHDRENEPRKAKQERYKEQYQYGKERAEHEGTSSEPMSWS